MSKAKNLVSDTLDFGKNAMDNAAKIASALGLTIWSAMNTQQVPILAAGAGLLLVAVWTFKRKG